MNAAVRDVHVEGHLDLVPALTLPDADDRHVLAAAIHCGAQAIVTFNLKDFPPERLAPYGIEAVHPDAFVVDLLDLSSGVVLRAVQEQQLALRNPTRTLQELIDTLATNGLVRTTAELRRLLAA